jgi:hypothetical protein
MADENQEVRVSFELELADVLAARRSVLLKSPREFLVPAVLLAAVVGSFATGDWSFAVGVVSTFVCLGFWLLYFQPRRSFRANPMLQGTRTCILSPGGLSIEVNSPEGNRLMKSDLDWGSIVRVRESSGAFFLSMAPKALTVLPKRAFDPSQIAIARSLLFAHGA